MGWILAMLHHSRFVVHARVLESGGPEEQRLAREGIEVHRRILFNVG